jgi:hypothetical protein
LLNFSVKVYVTTFAKQKGVNVFAARKGVELYCIKLLALYVIIYVLEIYEKDQSHHAYRNHQYLNVELSTGVNIFMEVPKWFLYLNYIQDSRVIGNKYYYRLSITEILKAMGKSGMLLLLNKNCNVNASQICMRLIACCEIKMSLQTKLIVLHYCIESEKCTYSYIWHVRSSTLNKHTN